MKTILLLISVFLVANSGHAQTGGVKLPQLICQSPHKHQFKFLSQGNPRNGAHAMVQMASSYDLFGGAWLKVVEVNESSLFSKYVFQAMNGSSLSITKAMNIGTGNPTFPNCGRAGCKPMAGGMDMYSYAAKWVGPQGTQHAFTCYSP